jgi:hypothetical protein
MADILMKNKGYETPTAHISAINRADVITTSGGVDEPVVQPEVPNYSGGEWDPFEF